MVTGDDWGQKQAEGAQEVGEGTLFWLTAYLQLGNCILKYFNLSNIYKYVIGNLTATITLTSLWPVPVLSPTFLPVGSQFRESREPVPQRQSPALTALGTGEETGPALRIYSALSSLPHRKLTGRRGRSLLRPFHTTSQLFSFKGWVCCAPGGLEAWHRCWGEVRAPCLGRTVSVHTTQWHQGPSRASEAFGSMASPWPRDDTHCHGTQG